MLQKGFNMNLVWGAATEEQPHPFPTMRIDRACNANPDQQLAEALNLTAQVFTSPMVDVKVEAVERPEPSEEEPVDEGAPVLIAKGTRADENDDRVIEIFLDPSDSGGQLFLFVEFTL